MTIEELMMSVLIAGGAVTASAFIPRVGPARAAWIALRSRFSSNPLPNSLRTAELKSLKTMLLKKDLGQGYLVITGEKGIGKSCLIQTATNKTPGVINLSVSPGTKHDDIVKNALQKLTGTLGIRPFGSAKRVVFWHRLFTSGRSPIIILNPNEKKASETYAGLTSAVKTLVEDYNLRVVVNGTLNSFDKSLIRTNREIVLKIEPMTKEMIWKVEQIQDLFGYVGNAGLDDIVFAVLGGNPSKYQNLWNVTKSALKNGQNSRQVIGTHLRDVIHSAIKLVHSPNVNEEIIKLFDKKNNCIPLGLLEKKRLARHIPDNIFCEAIQNNRRVVVPASNAIGIVLRNELYKPPTFDKLEELINLEIHGIGN